MELNERISAARRAAGMSQEQLGEALGVSRQAVSKWESGQTKPDLEAVGKMCELFHLSADYLLLGKEDKKDDGLLRSGSGPTPGSVPEPDPVHLRRLLAGVGGHQPDPA